jgi:hypothetical protein
VGVLSLIRAFFGPPSHVYPVVYKEWPVSEYLNSNCGANLGGLRNERKFVKGPQFTLSSLLQKRSNWSMVLQFKEPYEGHFSWSPKVY